MDCYITVRTVDQWVIWPEFIGADGSDWKLRIQQTRPDRSWCICNGLQGPPPSGSVLISLIYKLTTVWCS